MRTSGKKNRPEIIHVADGQTQLKIQQQARSDLYSTFRVGGPADFLVRTGSPAEVQLALSWARERDLPVTVFGGGSNMLVSDRGIRGMVMIVRRPSRDVENDLEVLEESASSVVIRVPAAAPLTWLGRTASSRGWAGMTWGSGLPGNIGGATVNNAGAHGTEMKDHLVSLCIADRTGAVREVDREWLAPEYRWTRLKAGHNPRGSVVLDVVLELEFGSAEALQTEAEAHAEYRHETQPTGACAGSIFKNPADTFSGLLVERCGLKGLRVGGAVVSNKHANFIVNDDNARAADIVELMAQVQEIVRLETGYQLEPEIERVGEW